MPGRRATQAQRRRHEEAADWLLRNQEAERRGEDREPAFRDWLGRDPENAKAYALAERLMGDARTAIESDPALRDFNERPRKRAKPVLGSLLALVLAGSLFVLLDGPMRMRADVISSSGETPLIHLADGSSVRLNASSAIAYDYTDGRRTIELLRGEAFFQVAHDPRRPFVVEAGNARVTALGTAFDVRRGASGTDVTVTENAVKIDLDDTMRTTVQLGEGKRIAYAPGIGFGPVRDVDDGKALAWRDGKLVLDDAPLSYAVEELGRHFSGRIVIAGADLAKRRISGTLETSDPQAALTFVGEALGVTVTRIGPLVIIRN